jgi:NAD(P)-dependent dehydrogenase (short-subunit alcohol dehydrogenase family)
MPGRVVVIVGGSSGLGLATAERFAEDGDHILLAARSSRGLATAAEKVRAAGAADVTVVPMDVRNRDEVDRLVETSVREHGRIDVLVHTATTMAYGRLTDLPADIFEGVVDAAIHGTANLARSVVPLFRRQHHGTFVIVNSLLGAVTVPNMGAYATAKWGQRAIARTLQQELRDEPNVHVCLVSPGSTNTPIYYQAASYTGRVARPPVPVLQPAHAASVIAAVVRRPRRHVSTLVGPTNPIIVLGYRLLPRLYDAMVGPLFRIAAQTRRALDPTPGNVAQPHPDQERVHGRWPDRDG